MKVVDKLFFLMSLELLCCGFVELRNIMCMVTVVRLTTVVYRIDCLVQFLGESCKEVNVCRVHYGSGSCLDSSAFQCIVLVS